MRKPRITYGENSKNNINKKTSQVFKSVRFRSRVYSGLVRKFFDHQRVFEEGCEKRRRNHVITLIIEMMRV